MSTVVGVLREIPNSLDSESQIEGWAMNVMPTKVGGCVVGS